MMTIVEKLNALRTLMKDRSISVYMIPTSDFHETEYVGEHFKARAFMSGFTGSQGTLVVTMSEAALWTDGRYFIQAADQLKDTTITLMKQGEEGVPTLAQYIYDHMSADEILGFDGRVMNSKLVGAIAGKLADKNITISYHEDLVGIIWEDRPALPERQGYFLNHTYSGKSTADKLVDVREKMSKLKATHHIITSLDDIAWITNMRGWDINCYPVVLSYLLLSAEGGILYVDSRKLNEELIQNMNENNIAIKEYHEIYEDVKLIAEDAVVLLDTNKVNYAITQNLPQACKIIDRANPSQMMKAIKNEIELENNRKAHIKDAVAMTKFMYWLKMKVGKEELSEISASDYLKKLRIAQGAMQLSFETISAYKEHAAMMHYSATKETNAMIKPEGMLLVDSGGQYMEGTTDITRTFVLGDITEEERFYFTTALRSNIALSKAHFLYGCRGMNLDILARGPLWDHNMDYKCGTGHGVGHLLNVHEGPNGFRWKIVPERNDSCVLEAGMTQSNEPGVYEEGKFGIRHENEMVVCSGDKNDYGQFMYFETITFVPFDLDGLDVAIMTQYEREWLNSYHAQVYDKLSAYLSDEECSWLKEVTRAI